MTPLEYRTSTLSERTIQCQQKALVHQNSTKWTLKIAEFYVMEKIPEYICYEKKKKRTIGHTKIHKRILKSLRI